MDSTSEQSSGTRCVTVLCEIVSRDHPNEILISTFFRILIFKAFWRNDNFWVKCLLFFSFLVHENRLTKGLGYLYQI